MAEESAAGAPRRSTTSTQPLGRRSRRLPIGGVLVAIDAPDVADQPWVVEAIDINAGGMGLVLPPELAEDTRVTLSFQLDKSTAFSQVPAIVRHRDAVNAGVHFEPWPLADRSVLLEFLVEAYESEA